MELIANNHITPEFEYRYLINGKTHYMVSNHTIQYDEDGKNIGSFGTVQDITTTKLIALALKKSEEEKAVILNHTQTLICVHDLNGVLMDINPAAEKVTGFTKAEIIGSNLRLIISPDHYGDFDNYLTTINNNKIASGKMDVITKNGESYVALIDTQRLDYYHRLERERIHLLLLDEAQKGLLDVAEGRTRDARQVIRRLKRKRQPIKA